MPPKQYSKHAHNNSGSMENPEEILQCLEEFSKIKPKDIPRELEEYLCFVAKTGNPVYQWPVIKCLFRQKLINVISEFYETCPAIDIPPCLNVDLFNYNTMKTFILEKLDTFVAAPFTVQRICELLTTPRKQYNRIDKYMRALEKNILVVSTTEPVYRSTENGDNNNQAIVNGLESDHLSSASSDDTPNINIEEMDDSPPQSTPSQPWSRPHNITINTNEPSTDSLQLQGQEQPSGRLQPLLDTHTDATPTVVVVEGVGNAGVAVGELVFGASIEEDGGSSDDDEDEENRLLAGENGVEKDAEQPEEELVKIEDQPPPQSIEPISAKPPLTTSSSSDELTLTIAEPTIVETIVEAPSPTELPQTIVKKQPTVDQLVIDQGSSDEIVCLNNDALILVETDAGEQLEVDGGMEGREAKEEGDRKEEEEKSDCAESNNMSDKNDIKATENIETPAETVKKLPSSETTESPEETSAPQEITNAKSDSEEVTKLQIDDKPLETSEIIDKETDVEKHDTSAIVKEAEKLEKEVTEMENILEVEKVEEKLAESVEKIGEIVANAGEIIANVENNVEQDERMEVDDDTLPDNLEATSASL